MKKINLIGIILAFFAGIGVGWVALKNKIQPALRNVISDLVDDVTDDIYPCRLIATVRFNQKADKTIVDMSQYAGNNNGMKRVSEIFKGDECYGEVTLKTIHRSRIAALAQLM